MISRKLDQCLFDPTAITVDTNAEEFHVQASARAYGAHGRAPRLAVLVLMGIALLVSVLAASPARAAAAEVADAPVTVHPRLLFSGAPGVDVADVAGRSRF